MRQKCSINMKLGSENQRNAFAWLSISCRNIFNRTIGKVLKDKSKELRRNTPKQNFTSFFYSLLLTSVKKEPQLKTPQSPQR